jgi:hypothetical protein
VRWTDELSPGKVRWVRKGDELGYVDGVKKKVRRRQVVKAGVDERKARGRGRKTEERRMEGEKRR